MVGKNLVNPQLTYPHHFTPFHTIHTISTLKNANRDRLRKRRSAPQCAPADRSQAYVTQKPRSFIQDPRPAGAPPPSATAPPRPRAVVGPGGDVTHLPRPLRRGPRSPRAAEPPATPAQLRVPGWGAMPCRREEEEEGGEDAEGEEEDDDSFLLLEQSVALGGSAEVDRLVAQIGETLQLDAAHDSPASPCAPPGPPLQPPPPPALPLLLPPGPPEAVGPAPPGALRCALGDRGRVRDRAAPYFVAELAAGPGAPSSLPPQPGFEGPSGADKQGAPQPLSGPCRRGWLRGATASRRLQQRRGPPPEAGTGEDDPHRLLQQLVLSGNLIKEAVRRLHSRRLRLHAKLPQSSLLGPLSAPVHEPPSPRSPRVACSEPGASGRKALLRTGEGVLVPGS
ncbi:Proto-oncogene FRAT1 [Galemys pyrenaicus]|uniref:Proto-oncogene FRAT1 n=1 Tax=Galemys pyrenaicus TaxID=202257 RepID=A0A8J6AL20_GALPY|nr:Proto-oncogene FRAT1 [Galemys pyrenaicus]